MFSPIRFFRDVGLQILYILAVFVLSIHPVQSQNTPSTINYQAVARDIQGVPLSELDLQIEVGIIETSIDGSEIYIETHEVTTDIFGLFTLQIGAGAPVQGDFSSIPWGQHATFLKVSIDAGSGTLEMPIVQLLAVPYALHANTASYGPDEDADPQNELQTLSKSGNTINLSNGGGSFVDEVDDADADLTNELQTLSKSGNTVNLSNGGGSFVDEVNDADADLTNELQMLSKSGSTVTLSNGGGSFVDEVADADADPTNEIQEMELVSNDQDTVQLALENSANIKFSIQDADANSQNELQTLSKSESTVTLSNGGGSFIDEVNDADADETNELQTISKSGSTVTLSNGGGSFVDEVDDADADVMNEIQELQFQGNTLTLSNDPSGTSIDFGTVTEDNQQLSVFEANTDTIILKLDSSTDAKFGIRDADYNPTNEFQDLSISSSNASEVELAISDGSGVTIPIEDADADLTNELQTISKTGSTVTLSNSGGSFVDEVDDADADLTNELQTLTKLGSTVSLSNGGGSFIDEVDDADADAGNELQSLQLSGNTLSLSADPSSTTVDLGTYNQQMAIQSQNDESVTLQLENSPNATFSIKDADFEPDNEFQDLSVSSSNASEVELAISDGSGVTIPIEDADADAGNELQSLQLSGNSLSLSADPSSTTVDLGTYNQQMAIQSQNDESVTLQLENSPNATFSIKDADFEPDNEFQDLSVSSSNASEVELVISDGSGVTIPIEDADADLTNELQSLQLSGNTLSLSADPSSTTVDLGTYNQQMAIQSQNDESVTLQLENSPNAMFSIKDADFEPDNEFQDLSVSSSNASEVELAISDGSGVTIPIEDADADAGNELQSLQLSGNTLSLSADPSSTTVDLGTYNQQMAIQSQNDESVTLQLENSPNATFSIKDADFEPDNEFQDLSVSSSNASEVELVISDGSGVTIPIEDADADLTNELQTISKTGSTVTLSNSGGSFIDEVNDADADPTNETISNITLDASSNLLIEEAGATQTVDLSSLKDSEHWVSNGTHISNDNTGNVGIMEANPTSNLAIGGSMAGKVRIEEGVNAHYTLGDEMIFIGKPITRDVKIDLPDASTVPGRIYYIKNGYNNWSDDVIIYPATGQKINYKDEWRLKTYNYGSGGNSWTDTEGIVVVSDGIDTWWVISWF